MRILHLSDFHFDGSRELTQSLKRMVDVALRLRPDVLVVTGDLSANGRAEELAVVADELDRFGSLPKLVLPGNRDLEPSTGAPGEAVRLPVESDLDYFLALEPALSFEFADDAGRRNKATESTWVDGIGPLEPTLNIAGLQAVALNSTPRLATGSLERAARRLRSASRGSMRVVALHHGLLPVPGRKLREGDVTARAGDVLALLCDLRVDLVLHGHIHRAHVWQISDGRQPVVVASAGALVNDGRRDASFLEVVADGATLTIHRRSVATGAATTLFSGTRRSSLDLD